MLEKIQESIEREGGGLLRKLTDLPGRSVISVLVLCNSTTIRLFNFDIKQ